MTNNSTSSCNIGGGASTQSARITLRKRTAARNEKGAMNLSSYNSDFLSGLFADVAKANVLTELGIPQKRPSELISSDDCEQARTNSASNKKSRTTLTRSLSRVSASSMNLAQLPEFHSPKGINEFFGTTPANKDSLPAPPKGLAQCCQHDSLAFQLGCVSGATEEQSNHDASVVDAGAVAFPNLPATVSDSSCNAGLTRANLVRPVSNPEIDAKDSFGWFVDLDDNQTPEPQSSGLAYSVSNDDLAFQAPTAPMRVNHDAEVEWAKAADTVDDVLGDFF